MTITMNTQDKSSDTCRQVEMVVSLTNVSPDIESLVDSQLHGTVRLAQALERQEWRINSHWAQLAALRERAGDTATELKNLSTQQKDSEADRQ